MNEPEIVSKTEFAKLCGVSGPAVSQWIKHRKIQGEAIVGEGRSAQIRVSVAREQLRLNLDIGQRMGNGLSTKLDGPTQIEAPSRAPVPPVIRDPIEEQIKRERLETAKRVNRKMAEEEAARAGRYVLAEDASRQTARCAADLMQTFDGMLQQIYGAIAAAVPAPLKIVQHAGQKHYLQLRAAKAAALKAEADRLPEFVEDNSAAAAEDELEEEEIDEPST